MSGDFTHETLGPFQRDARFADLYRGEARWCGREVKLVLSDEVGPLEDAAAHAQSLLEKAILWDAELRERIHESYYSIWNESWREDEAELGKAEWMARFSFESLDCHADGQFTAWFKDGDLFWGHQMEVMGSIDGGVERVTMMG